MIAEITQIHARHKIVVEFIFLQRRDFLVYRASPTVHKYVAV